ncbi:low-affinity Zn(2+) transporter zrt2 [Podospora pseudoanserina]|uniref:Low-affinity Zn(2+) transporter zrt2 n=1 Tax=Podospora pseudoanserina TaxID=2609844 RepID=A0ABR0HM19_9PEZI|nr:low-affinity Zn(2+) transporter zrt2 [Podospora pseudoanserina]
MCPSVNLEREGWSNHTMQRSELLLRDEAPAPSCVGTLSSRDDLGLRIASVFIILLGSAVGALLPVWLARSSKLRVPKLCFFVAKYFGTGVIIATAFMHLLSPASDNFRDECLEHILPEYDWAMGIGLATVMVMFLLEILVSRFDFGFHSSHGHQEPPETLMVDSAALRPVSSRLRMHGRELVPSSSPSGSPSPVASSIEGGMCGKHQIPVLRHEVSYPPGGENHLGHLRDHIEGDEHPNFAGQMTALFILEFGVIFHSIFIGLTLAVTENFTVLFVVLVFHQTFEGLGLGARLATATWPPDARRWTPYVLGTVYALSTPLAIGIGLIASKSMSLEATTSKIVNGVFDAISGGILLYTGLVELLAHEFMFNPEMRKAGLQMQLCAYGCVFMGVFVMALLAKWA